MESSRRNVLAAVFVTLMLVLSGCGSEAKRTLKGYLNAQTCADRVQYILDPEANKAALLGACKDSDCPKKFESIDEGKCADVAVGKSCYANVTWQKDSTSWYCLTRTSDGLKIDWRCSKGYNEISLPAFEVRHQAGKPALFRLRVTLSTDYYGAYGEVKDAFYAFKAADTDGNRIDAYMLKSNPGAAKLMDLLKDGKSHPVVAELDFDPQTKTPDQLTMTRFVGDGWNQLPEEVGSGAK